MDILIERPTRIADALLGVLLVNEVFQCYTREHPERTDRIYVAGESALPKGRYNVIWEPFRGSLTPLIVSIRPAAGSTSITDFPYRIGARFHPGHHVMDRHADIELGKEQLSASVSQTRIAYREFMGVLEVARVAGEAIDLEIR